jgi:arsenate reductase
MKAAATHYGVDGIFTFSGGTESTAFNSRMVTAMERAGFMIKQLDEWDNPKYLVRLSDEDPTLDIYFSKKFDDSYNPKSGFIAVMVCSDADEACPVVTGAAARVSLPYLDPKAADNTAEEDEAYDMKVMEIGREMLYVMRQVNQ